MSGVSGRVVHRTWDRFTSGSGGRRACGEGQELQSCAFSKCYAKSKSRLYKIFANTLPNYPVYKMILFSTILTFERCGGRY